MQYFAVAERGELGICPGCFRRCAVFVTIAAPDSAKFVPFDPKDPGRPPTTIRRRLCLACIKSISETRAIIDRKYRI